MYSPIKTPNITRLIKNAADYNVLVYDCDAPTGRVTQRLVYLLRHHYKLHFGEEATKIFVSPHEVPDISVAAGYYDPPTFYGLDVHYVKGLNSDWDKAYAYDYFKGIGGSLQGEDVALLMVGNNERTMLGSY